MAATHMRVEDLLGRDLTIRWYEGVALIQAVCRDQLERHTADVFPGATEILLHLDGAVSCLPPTSRGAISTAARLLSRMLSEDVPVRLRLIVTQAIGAECPYPTLADFSNALGYFERPDGQNVLQGLAERAVTAPFRAQGAAEPDGMEPPKPAPPPPGDEQRTSRGNLRLVVGAAVTAGCLYAAFLGTSSLNYAHFEGALTGLGLMGAGSSSSSSAGALAEKPEANGVGTVGGSQRRNASGAKPPSDRSASKAGAMTGQGTTRSAVPAVPTLRKDPGQVAAVLPLYAPGVSPLASGAEYRPVFGETVEVTASAVDPDDDVLPDGTRIYSRADTSVVPPRAVYPKLPSDPRRQEPDDRTILELVIGTNGLVERARLRSIPRDIHEFMLVSAAKAWIFEPATIEGLPVRYRHRVLLSLP